MFDKEARQTLAEKQTKMEEVVWTIPIICVGR